MAYECVKEGKQNLLSWAWKEIYGKVVNIHDEKCYNLKPGEHLG